MVNPSNPKKTKEHKEHRGIMTDYIIMLVVLCAAAVVNYKAKALWMLAVSVFTCTAVDRLGARLLKNDESGGGVTAVVTGLSIALLMPASAPWWLIVLTALFAELVCVLPFGSVRSLPFVPAAAAVCFASLCWSDIVFAYPRPMYESYFTANEMGLSVMGMLSQGISSGKNAASVLEIITGSVPSAIGAGSVLALLGALVYLIIRRPKNSIAAVCFLLSASLMSLAFPRISTGRLMSFVMEMSGGMMLFSAVFFMTYPSVMPKRILSRALWGFVGGIVCMLTRYVGFLEESACFAVIIMNALSGFFDNIPLTKREKKVLAAQETYIEIPQTVVPEDILDEIPDHKPTAEETEEKSEAQEDNSESALSESLDSVISEENTVTDTDAPFMAGGDGDE